MSYLRFNHVFFGLMALSFLSAFVFKPTTTERVKGQVQNIFTPVAWPVSRVTGWALGKVFPSRVRDAGSPDQPRTSAEVLLENQQLRLQLSNLQGQLQRVQQWQDERDKLGSVKDLCTRFSVAGADTGPRQSLLLAGSNFSALKEGMPVLYSGGVVGRISRDGGAQVLLVTDKLFKPMTAIFARLVKRPDGTLAFQSLGGERVLVRGRGDGTMIVENRPVTASTEIRKGDWLILSEDRDWPVEMDGYRIGQVDAIAPSRNPGFVNVTVHPGQNLLRLLEVMVMNKERA